MTLDDYISAHTSPEPSEITEADRATHLYLYNPRMCSGHLQGRLLKMLVSMARPRLVMELGTFSAYSALCMAEGLAEGSMLHTIEANDELEDFIRSNLARSPHGHKVRLHIGDAAHLIDKIAPGEMFDMAFIDADKRNYPLYYEMVKRRLRKGGFIVADNTLWDGHVIETERRDPDTEGIMRFNDMVAGDPDVEQVILQLRDGLTIIRLIG